MAKQLNEPQRISMNAMSKGDAPPGLDTTRADLLAFAKAEYADQVVTPVVIAGIVAAGLEPLHDTIRRILSGSADALDADRICSQESRLTEESTIDLVSDCETPRTPPPPKEDRHKIATQTTDPRKVKRRAGMSTYVPTDQDIAQSSMTMFLNNQILRHELHHGGDQAGCRQRLVRRLGRIFEVLDQMQEPTRSGCIHGVISSSQFDTLTSFIIILNSAFVAFTANWEMKNVGEQFPAYMELIDTSFLLFYSIELLLRLFVHRWYFFINQEMKWNNFDLVLVFFSLQDVVLSHLVSEDSSGNLAFMRIFRLMKVAKILRTFRVMRVFRELATILESFKTSFVSLFWCFVMLAFLLYIFALIIIQGMAGVLLLKADELNDEEVKQIHDVFGSVPQTMLSLYQAVTGGDDWANFYRVVQLTGQFYCVTFLFFTFFFQFALFNILTGVFVEKAVLASQPDRDDLILEQRKKHRKAVQEFRKLCRSVDTDRSGAISYNEFLESMSNELMVSYMASVGLEVHDVELFFKSVAGCQSLDEEIEIEKFVEGCLAMKGSATALDMRKQMFDMESLTDKLRNIDEKMVGIESSLEKVQLKPSSKPSAAGDHLRSSMKAIAKANRMNNMLSSMRLEKEIPDENVTPQSALETIVLPGSPQKKLYKKSVGALLTNGCDPDIRPSSRASKEAWMVRQNEEVIIIGEDGEDA